LPPPTTPFPYTTLFRSPQLSSLRLQADPPRDLHRGDQLGGLGALESLNLQQGDDRRLDHCPQRPELLQQLPPQLDRAGPLEEVRSEEHTSELQSLAYLV